MNVKQSKQGSYIVWGFVIALTCLVSAFSVQAGERFDTGLLWKIQRGGSASSYLFGTMHSDDPQVVELPVPVQRAFDESSGVTMEIVLDAQSLLGMATALLMTDGTTLESLVGRSLYQRSVEVLSSYGIPEMMVANMKPWAVAVTLMTRPAESGVVLDQVLYQQAVASGKKVDGLETVAEQIGLFDGLSKREQIRLLEDTLDNLDDIRRMLDQLQIAYLNRDLKRLVEINEASMRDSDPQLAETFNRKMIIERNHRMAERMQSRLREGKRFIAVGALHLPGEEGLLNLLSEQGYRLTRVY